MNPTQICSQSLEDHTTCAAEPPLRGLTNLLARVDRTWLVIGLTFLSIAVVVPSYWLESLRFTAANLVHIAPFIVLSAGLAGYLAAADADRLIGKVFSGREILAIGSAALFGALSPFCSCGVIPLIAALLVAGVPLSAVMAFWVSSPIMSPSMFVVTAAGLGLDFALTKTAAAVLVGLFAGGTTLLFQNLGFFGSVLKQAPVSGCGSAAASGSQYQVPKWRIWQERPRLEVAKTKTLGMVLFLSKWLTLAFVLESLMVAYVPAELLGQWLGDDSTLAIPLSAVVGVPAYLNGFTAVPVVAGLIESGMTRGAAMSFMLAGAMTSIPAAIAVYSLVRKRLFFWYLLLALVGAMAAGWASQAILV
jgi:uncharacterized membrane protein YraQ (UPF0718 family)